MEPLRYEFCNTEHLLGFFAHAHEGNGFLLEKTNPEPIQWLRFSTILHNTGTRSYIIALNDQNLIAGATIFYEYEEGEDIHCLNQATLPVGGISVREEFRGNHIATRMLTMLFEKAATEQKVIRIGQFEPLGKSYIAPLLPRLHADYPDVRILYRNEYSLTKGDKPYRLDFNGYGYKVAPPETLEYSA